MKISGEYFLNEKTTKSFLKGHPWIFSGQVKKNLFKNGDFIRIRSKKHEDLSGIGIYSENGLIAIRIISFQENFSLENIHLLVNNSIQKRKPLLKITNSLRWIHGENDFFPGMTIDMHGNTLVLMVYSDSVLKYARYVCRVLFSKLQKLNELNKKPINLLLKIPKRIGKSRNEKNIRVLRGKLEKKVKIQLEHIQYLIDPTSQKGGNFDDLRNLRIHILQNPVFFKGKKILHLFSNNGFTSIIFEKSGAKKIYSIDDSIHSIQTHQENLIDTQKTKHTIIKLDIFKKLKNFLEEINENFDVIMIDPPSLTSSSKDVKKAKNIYSSLILFALEHLEKKGIIILASCSNRIHKNEFFRICKETIQKKGKNIRKSIQIKNDIDHPVIDSFPEGDYLKMNIFFID